MFNLIFFFAAAIFLSAYFIYGKYLGNKFNINNKNITPAKKINDGVDYVPTKVPVLMGHHFSSIAGAGPIIGPIVAAQAFGWLAVVIWIIVGAVFIGGVHDYSALVVSIRNNARSIADIAKNQLNKTTHKLFLAFVWLTLVYVITVFADLTSSTFAKDGKVATASIYYIVLALLFGFLVYRVKLPLLLTSFIFVPLVFSGIWLGDKLPLSLSNIEIIIGISQGNQWDIALLIYCLIASILPVWFLLQPRDYLSSFLLYACLFAGFTGMFFTDFDLTVLPAIKVFDSKLGFIFPALFITVACGAVSGFHSLVASGTTSKQLQKETDAKAVGYGSMLIEGLLAMIALSTLLVVLKPGITQNLSPLQVFSLGIGKFISIFGISESFGAGFGILALSTFLLTTLDTCTRLGRFVFAELTGLKGPQGRVISTIATLALPALFILITMKDGNGNPLPAWKLIWPIFGATNQLLGGLALLVITVWLKINKRPVLFVVLPMIFVIFITIIALYQLILTHESILIKSIASFLLLLAVAVAYASFSEIRALEKNKG